MKTTRQPTELARTVAEGDMREDSAAKRLFQINEIAAWFLKTCVEEFNWMSIQDIVNGWIAKADRRLPPRRFDPKTFTLYIIGVFRIKAWPFFTRSLPSRRLDVHVSRLASHVNLRKAIPIAFSTPSTGGAMATPLRGLT